MASKKTVLPCQQNVPCRIEVRVTRTDRSAKKGRTGKQLEGLQLRLKDIDTGTIVQGVPIGVNSTGQEAEGPHCVGGGEH